MLRRIPPAPLKNGEALVGAASWIGFFMHAIKPLFATAAGVLKLETEVVDEPRARVALTAEGRKEIKASRPWSLGV